MVGLPVSARFHKGASNMMKRILWLLVSAALFVPSLSVPSHAQQKPAPAAKAKTGAKSTPAPGGKPKTMPNWRTTTGNQAIPSEAALNILIRRTLLTLNDANLSGNYSVLRDLAAPNFRKANDAAKLSKIFAKLRSAKIDMAPIVYFTPKVVRKPQLTKSGRLRLTGFVPTRPKQINFDMLFENHNKRWLLYGISVNISSPKTAAAAPKGKPGKTATKQSK